MTSAARRAATRPPPWRDARVLGVVTQVVATVVIVGALGLLVADLLGAMSRRRLSFDTDVLGRTAGFEIAESFVPYAPTDPYAHALLVGLVNTIVVSILGIVLATGLGLLIGVARLSRNWLVERLAAGYVEIFRNTPLLVQLLIIYFAIFLRLPPVRDSILLGDALVLNQRGAYMPRPDPLAPFEAWLALTLVGAVVALGLWWLASRRAAAGRPVPRLGSLGLAIVVGVPIAAWLLLGAPFDLERPEAGRFNISGGLRLSPELLALLVGLVLYTAAFIGEVVRGGIQAVPRGQLEASRALGLSEGLTLRLVVLPQALRVIIPPLTSQYLNLAKNSSLAVAIGYPDLFNVANTSANQTGQPVLVLAVVMGAYLALSLTTSLLMNLYNRRVQLRER